MPDRYRIFETKGFLKDLSEIKVPEARNILKKLDTYVYPILQDEPHFGPNIKKLKDWHPETWRYRIRNWRFFYEIDESDKIIFFTAADHRKDAY